MRLYRSKDHPGHWIGEDKVGTLMVWPAERRGWAKRTAYLGGKRALEEVEPALARGSGWAGGGRARHPRDASGRPSKPVTIRATDDERAAWTQRADEERKNLSLWARDTLNTEVARPRSKGKP